MKPVRVPPPLLPYACPVTPAQLSRTVLLSLHGVAGDAGWRVDLPERVVIESPPRRGGGDYATGVLLRLGRRAPDLAGRLARRLEREPGIGRVEVTGPGFVNVTLDGAGRAALVAALISGGTSGRTSGGTGIPGESTPDRPARDAARWSAATGEPTAALLVRTRASSLFRVQYAHARTRALLRNGAALGLEPLPGGRTGPGADAHPEAHYDYAAPAERALLALLADHARVAAGSPPAAHARHLTAVADAFLDAHDACPPLPAGGRKPLAAHRSRLALAEAAGTVLAGGLSQLGVTAPAHL